MWRKGNIPPVLEWKLAQPLWKSIWWFLRKLGIALPQEAALPLLDIHPKDQVSIVCGFISVRFSQNLQPPTQEPVSDRAGMRKGDNPSPGFSQTLSTQWDSEEPSESN